MMKPTALALALSATALALSGCQAVEVVAVPIVAPVVIAGELYQSNHEPTDWHRPQRDILARPGDYRFLSASGDPELRLTVHADRSVVVSGLGCELAGRRRPDLDRKIPGDWRPAAIFQVTAASGDCAPAAGGLVYIGTRLHVTAGVTAKALPFGNNLEVSLWATRCCSRSGMSLSAPPWPDFARVEAAPG